MPKSFSLDFHPEHTFKLFKCYMICQLIKLLTKLSSCFSNSLKSTIHMHKCWACITWAGPDPTITELERLNSNKHMAPASCIQMSNSWTLRRGSGWKFQPLEYMLNLDRQGQEKKELKCKTGGPAYTMSHGNPLYAGCRFHLWIPRHWLARILLRTLCLPCEMEGGSRNEKEMMAVCKGCNVSTDQKAMFNQRMEYLKLSVSLLSTAKMLDSELYISSNLRINAYM